MPTQSFTPDYAVPPGETLGDLLEEHDMSQVGLARRLGISTKHASQVITGSAGISADLALRLERVFGTPADFWLSRESQYRADLARRSEEGALLRWVDWAKQFPGCAAR